MQVPINEIIVKNRIRKNLGDLSGLMESIGKYGLLNPIIINSKKELIAGHRRLESCRKLGWETVKVRIVTNLDAGNKLEMEIDENLHRRNLSPDELAEAYTKLEKIRNPGFFRRIWNAIVAFFRRLFVRDSRNLDIDQGIRDD